MLLNDESGYTNDFLILGALLMLASGVLIALPFKWASMAGLATLVCGVVCLVLSRIYDPKRLAKKWREP